jgi:hypothetical protein
MLKNGLDSCIVRIIGVFEQDGGILRGLRRCADNPLTEDIGHERGLPVLASHWPGTETRETLARDNRR